MSSDDLKRSHRALSELEPVVKLAEQLKQKHKVVCVCVCVCVCMSVCLLVCVCVCVRVYM